MYRAVDGYAGQNSDPTEEGRRRIRNTLSDLLYLTSKRDRRIDINSGMMSLVNWVGCGTINWDRELREKNADFSKG